MLIFLQTKILWFIVEHYTIKMNIIWYYELPNSTAVCYKKTKFGFKNVLTIENFV